MSSIFCVLDSGTGSKLIRNDVSVRLWLEGIHKWEIPEIQIVSDEKLVVPGITTIHILLGEKRYPVTFSVMKSLPCRIIWKDVH